MIRKNRKADLRSAYRTTLEAAFALVLGLMIAAFKFFPDGERPKAVNKMPDDPIVGENVPATKHHRLPPPPPRPPIVFESPDADPLTDIPLSTDLVPGNPMPPPVPGGPDEIWFEAVEAPPEPVGGYGAIVKNLRYPDLARRVGIEGTVVVLAFVDQRGRVTRTEVLKGIGFGCDEAAVLAVEKTQFSPGLQRDKPVNVKLKIPVRFRLRN